MGRYDPLHRHLASQHGIEIELSFSDLERILGGALPKAARQAKFWKNEVSPTKRLRQYRAWTAGGFYASLVSGEAGVRFLRQGYKVVSRIEGVTYIAKAKPTVQKMPDARHAWDSLIKLLARTAAEAAHRHRIAIDMDDPRVARDVIKATFQGLFCAQTKKESSRNEWAAQA